MQKIQKLGSRPSQVLEEMRRMAREGDIQFGDRLPTEEQMVELLGVGRSSVREALRVLEFLGLVDVVQGRGTFLSSGPSRLSLEPVRWWSLTDIELYAQVLEARLSIEPAIARLAALRADDVMIAKMELTIKHGDPDAAHETPPDPHATVEFHDLCAEACGNVVFRMLFKGINELLRDLVQSVARPKGLRHETLCYHRHMIDAFKARDPDAAESIMREHLLHVQQALDRLRQNDFAKASLDIVEGLAC